MLSRRYIDTYTHGGRIGVMIELECETTVPLKSADFVVLVHDLAMQIAAQNPADISTLFHQSSIRNPDETVCDLLEHAEQKYSEKIKIIRFVRWSIDDPDPVDEDRTDPPPKRPASMMRVVK